MVLMSLHKCICLSIPVFSENKVNDGSVLHLLTLQCPVSRLTVLKLPGEPEEISYV